MDFDTLKRVQDAVALIRSGKLDTLAPGRHELSDGAYVNVFGYQTKESGIYEAHRKYIDIHYVLEGSCAVMLILFVLAINFMGDGLRDASDPTQIG